MSGSWVIEALGQGMFYFEQVRPMLPTYLHLIASAVFPIYTGAHASLHRPVSAGKPAKKASKDDESETDLQIEEETQLAAGFEMSDIVLYPLLAGGMLTGLYYLIKYLQDATVLSNIINAYLSIFGLFGVATFLSDSIVTILSYIFPSKYFHNGRIWMVDGARRIVLPQRMSDQDRHPGTRSSPLPSFLSSLPIPNWLLWRVRDSAHKPVFIIELQLLKSVSSPIRPTAIQIYSAFAAIGTIAYFNLVDRPWWMMNLLGFSFTYSAFQMMSPTRFDIGTGLLCALFFYDIYMVFYTPMMITVASKLDIPAKLVFPRPTDDSGKSPYAMLGLGDVVIPGIMIAFALRFDLYIFYLRKQKRLEADTGTSVKDKKDMSSASKYQKATYARVTGTWGDRFWLGNRGASTVGGKFPKPYFRAAMIGYVIGLVLTLGVMQVFNHGQPALLYLVPCVLGAIWSAGLIRGELKVMGKYTEDPEDARKANLDSAAILWGKVVESDRVEDHKENHSVGNESSKEDQTSSDKLSADARGDDDKVGPSQIAGEVGEKVVTASKSTTDDKANSKHTSHNRRLLSIVLSLPPDSSSLKNEKSGQSAEIENRRFAESFIELRSAADEVPGEPAGKRRRLA